ncbi:MAG: ABC transporter permease [Halobacteria archaeon]
MADETSSNEEMEVRTVENGKDVRTDIPNSPGGYAPDGGEDARVRSIDWTEVEDSRKPRVSRKTWFTLAAFLALVLIAIYDYLYVGNESLFWGLTAVEWLFALTLLTGFSYVVYPLYRNQRLALTYWRRFRKNRAAVVSLVYLAVIFVLGILGPAVLGKPEVNVANSFQPPVGITTGAGVTGTLEQPLGTNHNGKDMVKLVLSGMRVSMEVGLITTYIVTVMATAVGTTAAYYGGRVDEVLMRYVDLQLTFPAFILLIFVIYILGGNTPLFLLILVLGFLNWGGIARLVRSEALQRRTEEYVTSSKAEGASDFHVIRRHIVPNVSNTVITAATLAIPGFILTEATLSFLGFGDPTVASWGRTIANGRSHLTQAPWISTVPGLFLFGTILAFNFLGDALRDALDPRTDE